MTDETATVREVLEDALGDDDDIHGIQVSQRSGQTIYLLVSRSTTMSEVETAPDMDVPILDIRTVVVDLDADQVSLTDNGLWVPRNGDVVDDMTSLLGRSITDINREEPIADPALISSEDVDVDLLLDREIVVRQTGQDVDRMDREPGISASREWGYGGGPPPEAETVVERLQEAGLDPSEHLLRMRFGKKEPFDSPREPVPFDALKGNYGIETQPRDSGLVILDLDYPEEAPDAVEDLPETFETSSPHGSDARRHIYLYCPDKAAIADALDGAWAARSLPWGELWVVGEYVVGAGSQLSEYGCNLDEHEYGEPGACSRCSDPDGGFYHIVSDAPIATVDAETIVEDILPDDDEVEVEGRDRDVNGAVTDQLIEDHVRCSACGGTVHVDDTVEFEKRGETRHVCAGECVN